MKNLLALLGGIFAAKKAKLGCLGTIIVFIVVYYVIKNIL